jgi:signal transduction histidine kinase
VPRRRVPTGRLRRRLTVAFVLVAAISAGALATGSYALVRRARLDDSLERARDEAVRDVRLSTGFEILGASGPTPATFDVGSLLDAYENKGVHAIFQAAGQHKASNPDFAPAIPESLAQLVRDGRLAYQRVRSGVHHYLIVGSRIPGSTAELYFLFPEDGIFRDLAQLRNVLVAGWVIVVIVATVIGRALAQRTLEPVGRASQAARSMAEGLLATRLPVEGEDEFGQWAASFNEMAEALEGKIAALSEAEARERRFTSDVAHELRTPLSALVGEASLLRDHVSEMPEQARRPAELLIQDVARLRRLVEELMEISRLDAGRESVQPDAVDVPELVRAVVRSRGWHGSVRVQGEGVTARTDPRRLERVVANLIGNAIEHGGSDVQARVSGDARKVQVEVVDRGPGISPEHLPHLFERFYKADPARSGKGSGLGLAIALENARLLGGDIEAWSEPGMGTRFRLVLPASVRPVTEPLRLGEANVSRGVEHGTHPDSEGEPR